MIDFNLGLGPTGLDLAHRLRDLDPAIGIVLLTTYRDTRLHSDDRRALPAGAVYAVKDDVRSTSQLRAAIDVALGNGPRSSTARSGRIPLTSTQLEILRMVADGLTNAEIAERRGVSERSVQTAFWRILASAQIEPEPGVNPRVQMVKYYSSLGGKLGAP